MSKNDGKKQVIIGLIISFLLYGLLWFFYLIAGSFLKYTTPDINTWMNIVVTTFGTFFGPYAAILSTLWLQNKNKEEELDKNIEFSKNIINLFLIHEIKYNLNNVLGGKDVFYERFKNEDKPTQFGYRNIEIKSDEFDKIKYELIKYNNEDVNDIIELYFMFETLKSNKDISKFNQKQFDEIKKVYLKNVDKYLD